MGEFADAFTGRHVTVVSSAGGAQEHADTGTIVAMTEHWLQIAKDSGEMLIFPHAAIRVIKLLDAEPRLTTTMEDLPLPDRPPGRPRAIRDEEPLI